MKAFAGSEFEKYRSEAKENWGNTAAYREYEDKTKNYCKEKWNTLSDAMGSIMADFASCMKNGQTPDSVEAQELVKTLQTHITENYYLCTNEIQAGLGKMYTGDKRFNGNIDKYAPGTAAFIGEAIEIYCRK